MSVARENQCPALYEWQVLLRLPQIQVSPNASTSFHQVVIREKDIIEGNSDVYHYIDLAALRQCRNDCT